VHLDVKPENIIATPRPWLLDFGIACRVADAARLDAAIGTPAYMAPEQRACGDGRAHAAVGPAADVYALAATLYETLTGRAPRPSETVAPPQCGFGTPVLAGLDPDPRRRPTAAALAARLRLAQRR
jgi:serine/threonine protein kinase